MRAYWKGDEGMLPALARCLTASGDRFNRRGRRPWASVNFITAHDGFTLADLVSYNEKHNEANGEDNRDGHSDNRSWNCGAEGPTSDEGVFALRARQQRNLLATLLLAQGTPMVLAGDEFGRSQQGNNNAYCQDNEISWIDWEAITPADASLTAYVQRLIALRQEYAVLRRNRFLTGVRDEESGTQDVTWLKPDGEEMNAAAWGDPNSRCLGMLLDGRAPATGMARAAADATLLLIVNSWQDGLEFTLPARCSQWVKLLDTTDRDEPAPTARSAGQRCGIGPRSLVLLIGQD